MARTGTRSYRSPLTTSRTLLLEDGSDNKFRLMVDNLVAFAAQLQQFRQAIARRMGLSPPQYNILMILAHNGGTDTPIGYVAKRLRVSVPFVVKETQRLHKMGFLEKQVDKKDRRRLTLILTLSGRSAVEKIAPFQRDVNDALFATLDRNGFNDLIRLTNGLLGSCQDARARISVPPIRTGKQAGD